MCIPTKLQQNIISFTKDGEHIARFLTETMQGRHTDAKFNHRLEAARHLIKYGFTDTQCDNAPVRPEPVEELVESPNQSPLSPGERVRVRGNEESPPPTSEKDPLALSLSKGKTVSHLDILNYQIAHLIRHETAEGHTIANFLVDIMTGRDRPFTPKKFCIKPADRMAAARELLRRGFGDLGSRRRQSDSTDEANAYDTLHTDLAKRMREYSERGTDTVRFLLEVMSDPDPDLEFTIHHRMSAAQELLRRGWDTNYDNIRPEHLTDYWQDKESPRLSIGQKKTLSGLSTSIDDYDNYDDTDYEAIAKEMKEEEDLEAAASKSLHPRYGKIRTGVTEPVSNGMPRSASGSTATSKLPLPLGEGWGEGSAGILNKPLPPRREKSLPPAKAGVRMGVKSPAQDPLPNKAATVNEQDKAIIKEFREAMDRGDERAALRAEAKYRRIDVKPEKNIYDYGPNDPDPTIDYYFEPLNPEEQAKFDEEDRREHGLTEEEIADYSNMPAPRGMSDPLVQLAEAAAAHNTPILHNPLAAKHKNPTIRSP